mmetsp:Transcript_17444/g.60919  ORF Transcript_17444/g.60919 Transcript_17444/m.60919 type:complete len:304 (-) Transcript_17444:179-1090(-)
MWRPLLPVLVAATASSLAASAAAAAAAVARCPTDGCPTEHLLLQLGAKQAKRKTLRAASSREELGCSSTFEGEQCYTAVLWAKNVGIKKHPEWYPEYLSASSGIEDFQAYLNSQDLGGCMPPCEHCHTSTDGEMCHEVVEWAMYKGVLAYPGLFPGLVSGSRAEELWKPVCPQPCLLCRTARAGDQCFTDVTWAMTVGIHQHPEWYGNLTELSKFEAFQEYLAAEKPCPRPCDTCHIVPPGDRCCFDGVMWAKEHGIYGHPEWYPDLSPHSTFNAFQAHLHHAGFEGCPLPCTIMADAGTFDF